MGAIPPLHRFRAAVACAKDIEKLSVKACASRFGLFDKLHVTFCMEPEAGHRDRPRPGTALETEREGRIGQRGILEGADEV